MDADRVIAVLGLAPHPEGGLYRRTWADDAGSAIYYLLRRDDDAAWHRVHGRSELWHFYAGAPLELTVVTGDGPSAEVAVTRLGVDLAAGERPQVVVAPGTWQRARTLGAWTLAGCTVAPPFSFDAFQLAPPGWSPSTRPRPPEVDRGQPVVRRR